MAFLLRQMAVRRPGRRQRISLHHLVSEHAPAGRLACGQLPGGRARTEPGYADSFFADPVAVEDDYRRLRRGQ
jgi:hypothetical protein